MASDTCFLDALRPLLLSEKFADLTILCGQGDEQKEFKVHRAVVCSQSPFFNAAVTTDFKVRPKMLQQSPFMRYTDHGLGG
jgi:hypothetical protein